MHEPESIPAGTLAHCGARSALVLQLTCGSALQIERHLNFVTTNTKLAQNMTDIRQSKDVDVLINVRPFIVHLSKTLPELMVPGRNQCVDESGVLSEGRTPRRVRGHACGAAQHRKADAHA